MRNLRVIVGIAVILLCTAFFPNVVQATNAEHFLIRTYRMEIAVECLDSALPRIFEMPGIDLHSELNFQTGRGRVERLVNNFEVDFTLGLLRNLGEVSAASSHARNEFAQFNGLQSELRIRNEEERKLNELLLEAESLVDFRIIESRLVNLISEIESLRGRINFLNSEMGTTRINIVLTTIPEEVEPEPEPEEEDEEIGTLERIGNAFSRSADFTLQVVQVLVLFLAYASIPLGVIIIIAVCAWRLLRKKVIASNSKKIESGDENENK
ncbi:MAG: DUF4349 domain-containing protein [Defluviitaleaceae bacterium]|nr:DUF4349 domain-containing protein [Defluviitaleaceae bacterium]